MRSTSRSIRTFASDTGGAALVEFAISLPLILVVAYGAIDSMRLFWSYQATIAGVRDATRYLARVAPDDICATGGTVTDFEPALRDIVDGTIAGEALLPQGVSVTGLTAGVACIADLGLRQAQVPIVTVTADLRLELPYTGVLSLVGGTGWGTVTTGVTEQARVYGL